MKTKNNILIAIFIFILVSVACGGSAPAAPNQATETMVQATYQALTASAPRPTITRLPPMTFAPLPFTVQATLDPTSSGSASGGSGGSASGGSASGSASGSSSGSTPEPTSDVNVSSAYAVYFANGATSASVAGGVKPNHTITYSLYVVGNQPAQVSLRSESTDLKISIYDPNRNELLSPSIGSNSWKGYFKQEGIYFIKVHGGAATSTFNLVVSIAARVIFADGANQLVLKSSTVGGNTISYAVYASQGQTMQVSINNAPEVAALTIWGFTNNKFYAQAEAGTTSFSLLIPETQDYIIDIVPKNGKYVNYTLDISLK